MVGLLLNPNCNWAMDDSAQIHLVVQGMMGAFVDFIKERKTVALEELAAEFGLRVQVCCVVYSAAVGIC